MSRSSRHHSFRQIVENLINCVSNRALVCYYVCKAIHYEWQENDEPKSNEIVHDQVWLGIGRTENERDNAGTILEI